MAEASASAYVNVRHRKHRRRLLGLAVVAVIAVASGIVAWRLTRPSPGLAQEAVITASSTALGFSVRDLTSGSIQSPGAGWQSNEQTSGAWIELNWSQSHLLRKITLVRNPIEEIGVTDGFLSFSDGSYVQVRLSTSSRVTVVPISPRSVHSFRFTVSGVSAGARSASLAEIVVSDQPGDGDLIADPTPDGNEAPDASATQSVSAGATDPGALIDGTGTQGIAGVGADWTTLRPEGAWVQLNWSAPRELSSIQVAGAIHSAVQLMGATLTFADGTQLPVGAVLNQPDRPTTVSFMPRITTSVRLTVDRAAGNGPLSLSELRAYRRGATPVRYPSGGASSTIQQPIQQDVSCVSPTIGTVETGLEVRCPQTGSVVAGMVNFRLSAATGYSAVSAILWPADAAVAAGVPVHTAVDPSGVAELTVDLSGSPPGPLTVEFEATGPEKATAIVFFQLYRAGDELGGDVPSSAAANGRTLAFAEEFDRPISISRTGLGADYAGAKPTYDGAEDFGDAPFPDDTRGFGNVQVVDNRYLRMDLMTVGAGSSHYLGGLLASARTGGSGFSAQYAYFEARMLAPAAAGTWPAFWLLPSDNLVAPTPAVAEIDAVELYGHEPTGACQSTHQYENGIDGGIAQCGRRFATARDALDWHDYGVSVTPIAITFYIDGRVVATAPQVHGGGSPMFFLVNLALGGGWPVALGPVQDRAELYVDYVRVYV